MAVNTAKFWVLALALAGMGLAGGAARGDVITFTGVPNGLFVGPFTEGNFTYSRLSGSLLATSLVGNPAPSMEGALNSVVNSLKIVQNGGGLFTFDGAEVAQFDWDGRAVTFRGVLGGIVQASVDLIPTANDNDFAGGSQGRWDYRECCLCGAQLTGAARLAQYCRLRFEPRVS